MGAFSAAAEGSSTYYVLVLAVLMVTPTLPHFLEPLL
jgi:hypothetical protein